MTRDPGTLLATTHALRTGERVRLRLTRPSDAGLVQEFLDAAGPELVRHFTYYDPRERIVIAATLPVDGRECIVGIGDVAVLETGLAELGLVVDDDRQGQGIGTLLSEALAVLAVQRGATHVKAEMLEGNLPMARVMERLGPTVRTAEKGHAVLYARLDALRSRVRAA